MKKLTTSEYNKLKLDHEEGSKVNDYSRMIMSGDKNDLAMRKYLRDNNLCQHKNVRENLEGGRFDECRDCGKIWG